MSMYRCNYQTGSSMSGSSTELCIGISRLLVIVILQFAIVYHDPIIL